MKAGFFGQPFETLDSSLDRRVPQLIDERRRQAAQGSSERGRRLGSDRVRSVRALIGGAVGVTNT